MAPAADPGRLRVGDAEREAAVAALGEHFTAGRLTLEEFDARTSAAYAAKTRGDLDALFLDLPTPARPMVPPPAAAVRRRSGVPAPLVVLLAVVAFPAVLFALHVPWLLFPLLFIVIGRSRRRRGGGGRPGGYGPGGYGPGNYRAGGYGPGWGPNSGEQPGAPRE